MQLGTAQKSILAVLVCWPAHTPHTEHPDLPSGALSVEHWGLGEGGWLAVGATASTGGGTWTGWLVCLISLHIFGLNCVLPLVAYTQGGAGTGITLSNLNQVKKEMF